MSLINYSCDIIGHFACVRPLFKLYRILVHLRDDLVKLAVVGIFLGFVRYNYILIKSGISYGRLLFLNISSKLVIRALI